MGYGYSSRPDLISHAGQEGIAGATGSFFRSEFMGTGQRGYVGRLNCCR
jgi:hypothetical protein